ncbi:LysR family transcriptional regulator [Chromobacterium sp. IIBBL 290-4]|uniref:LysR family transcriptional regulator n=1 Tax=Chromobacterium sp. IIBBL 290-4 TaxID=2953890 RepID=UPI0020B816B1|nr:LysR family transcriptional regulator [Chromobacterium sp. IIBBL 290-4]UTH74915.1 LysR family transcriptional regulator [Chromobacterium sp. IIBBL 290-4]
MPRLQHDALQSFALIARLRSFTRAAAELGVTASALSQTLRQLEAELGVPLLIRTTRQVSLTDAGEALLERLNPALDTIRQALDDVRQMQGQPAGTLRLTLPHSAAQIALYPYLGEFLRRHPALMLELDINDGLVDIVGQRFDAGIRFSDRLQAGMQAAQISRLIRFVVVATPEYLASHGTPQTPEDLLRHACIGYRFGANGPQYRWQFIEAGQPLQLALSGPLVTNDNQARLLGARGGIGLAYLAEDLIRDDIAAGRLVSVLEPYLPPAEAMYLFYPQQRRLPAKLRALIDFLRQANGIA